MLKTLGPTLLLRRRAGVRGFLHRFEQRLFPDTPLVYDALTVSSLTGIPNRDSNLSPGPVYPGPVPP